MAASNKDEDSFIKQPSGEPALESSALNTSMAHVTIDAPAEQPQVKDNRLKAIFFMNLFSIGSVTQGVAFKLAVSRGASVLDFTLFRNMAILLIAIPELMCLGKNPIKEFPWNVKWTLFFRCLTGQACFFFLNLCFQMAPMTFCMIIFQSSSFWISILAFFAFGEQIYLLEMVAMVICFAGMVTITLSGTRASEDGAIDESESNYTSQQLIIGYSLIFMNSWIYASNCVLNRALKGIHHSMVMFFHGCFGFFIVLTIILLEEAFSSNEGGLRILNYDASVYGIIALATAFDCLAVNSMTIAFQSDSSGFVSLISYISIIYTFISDSFIFHESFTWVELVAAFFILFATVGTSVYKLRESAKLRRQRSISDSFQEVKGFEPINDSQVKAA